LGLALDLTILRPVYRRHGEARVLLSLLLTLGVAFIIDGLLNWRYPLKGLTLRIGGGPIEILGVRMVRGSVVASVISIVTIALLMLFLRRTTLGRAARSVIEDEEGARLVGIDPHHMLRLILVLSGALAALVAVTQSMVRPINVSAGFELTVFALIVTVVGGLGSVTGALLAGVILGVVNSIALTYIGTSLSLIILLGAAAITILIRPSGLLGVRE
jgi:branched-chain amino acid transport system permease protein